MTETQAPIFLHSLFRAGSTYFFEVFRRSAAGYWCYQEPENEIILKLADPSFELPDTERVSQVLRHPRLDRSYLAEFLPLRPKLAQYFSREIPYDTYFLAEESEAPALYSYINFLIEQARGRPLLQLCKSSGRMAWLRKNFSGLHLFLWRNPWDQWWSYKVTSYFDAANLRILNARSVPPVFREIQSVIGFQAFHAADLAREEQFFDCHGLSPELSYLLHFSIWYHAMHEGLSIADVVIGVDQLSLSADVRQSKLNELGRLGVVGLDLSDCKVPQGWYSQADRTFFEDIEARVLEIFRHHGYTDDVSAQIRNLRTAALRGAAPDVKRDLEQVRALFIRNSAELSRMKKMAWDQQVELAAVQSRIAEIRASLSWRLTKPLRGLALAYDSVFGKRSSD